MRDKETLYYTKKEFDYIAATLERLKKNISCNFAIVGGIANRFLFAAICEDSQLFVLYTFPKI